MIVRVHQDTTVADQEALVIRILFIMDQFILALLLQQVVLQDTIKYIFPQAAVTALRITHHRMVIHIQDLLHHLLTVHLGKCLGTENAKYLLLHQRRAAEMDPTGVVQNA